MEAFFVSTLAILIGEIGDKTQFLALVLAARFRRPLPIACGILAATLLNHAVAALLGTWAGFWFDSQWFRLGVGVSFLLLGVWALIPDKQTETYPKVTLFLGAKGAFLVTLGSFFLVEIGDKTQVATVILAARYEQLIAVVGGTTLGMLVADLPVIWLGNAMTARVPFALVRFLAALLFVVLGALMLLNDDFSPLPGSKLM